MNEELTFLPLTVRQVDDLMWLHYYLQALPEEWRAGFEWWIFYCAEHGVPYTFVGRDDHVL